MNFKFTGYDAKNFLYDVGLYAELIRKSIDVNDSTIRVSVQCIPKPACSTYHAPLQK